MDIIKRTINIDSFRSRVPAMLPYIDVDSPERDIKCVTKDSANGDLGGILLNYSEYDKTTIDLFSDYHKIKDILRGGLKVKKTYNDCYVENFDEYARWYEFVPQPRRSFNFLPKGVVKTKDGVTINNDYIRILEDDEYDEYEKLNSADTLTIVEGMIGLIRVPSSIQGSLVPDMFYATKVKEWIDWFNLHKGYAYIKTTKAEYDAAPLNKKVEITGQLPEKVTARSKDYVCLIYGDSNQYRLYYKKTDDYPDDCCLLEEWNNRGGKAMWDFLKTKQSTASAMMASWSERYQTGMMSTPSISLPILLTQDYDDNGILSVCGDEPYDGSIIYVDDADMEAKTFGTESKLQQLRSREKIFDDFGNVLPFIGKVTFYDCDSPNPQDCSIPTIPFKVNEGFNVSYDEETSSYVGDYIKSITYLGENGDESDLCDAKYVEFEYVIGGEYDPTKSNALRLNPSAITVDYRSTAITVTLTATKDWIISSNNGDVWATPSVKSGNSGDTNITINISKNLLKSKRFATITFATTDKYDYQETYLTITQGENQEVLTPTFSGSGPASVTNKTNAELTCTTKIICTNSNWYVKSKPSFVRLSVDNGLDGVPVNVVVTSTSFVNGRKGDIIFAADKNANITYKVSVVQQADNSSLAGKSVSVVGLDVLTQYSNYWVLWYLMGNHRYDNANHFYYFKYDEYEYEIVSGNPNVVNTKRQKTSGNGYDAYGFSNNNNTGTEQQLKFRFYVTKGEYAGLEAYKTLTVPKLMKSVVMPVIDLYKYWGTASPERIQEGASETIEYGKQSEQYAVVIGPNQETIYDWHVVTDPSSVDEWAEISVNKPLIPNNELYDTHQQPHSFIVRNKNTGEDKTINVHVEYETEGHTSKSTGITFTLLGGSTLNLNNINMYIDPGITQYMDIMIGLYPKSVGESGARYYDMNASGWVNGGTMERDVNDEYVVSIVNTMANPGENNNYWVSLENAQGRQVRYQNVNLSDMNNRFEFRGESDGFIEGNSFTIGIRIQNY